MEKQQLDFYSGQIIDSALQVHKEFGPGLLESVYQFCLAEELRRRNIKIRQEVFLPLVYKGTPVWELKGWLMGTDSRGGNSPRRHRNTEDSLLFSAL